MKKMLNFVVVALAQIALAATPQVKNVRAFQQYPWGKVGISFEVEGDISANVGSGKTPILFVVAKDKTTGRIYGDVSSAEGFLSGDTGTATGLHKVVWDVGAQGIPLNSSNVAFLVVYCDEQPYWVVDLSSGANSSSYPVSLLFTVPSGGWTDVYKTTKLVLRRIVPGSFKMGGAYDVTLTKPFYIGVFEVTQKQWELVMGSNPCSSTSYGKGNNYPVHKVSYDMIRGSSNGAKWPSSSAVDSDSFMGKLRARTGLDFDLPTEAQWEYACRAGTTTTFYWGNTMNDNYAWNDKTHTHPVGTKIPNGWGLYDMSGNVAEWCLDWYGALAYGTDLKGSSSGSVRMLRGGSWISLADGCTSSFRSRDYPSSNDYDDGFRLARTLSN